MMTWNVIFEITSRARRRTEWFDFPKRAHVTRGVTVHPQKPSRGEADAGRADAVRNAIAFKRRATPTHSQRRGNLGAAWAPVVWKCVDPVERTKWPSHDP
jgi:hypothetical protein